MREGRRARHLVKYNGHLKCEMPNQSWKWLKGEDKILKEGQKSDISSFNLCQRDFRNGLKAENSQHLKGRCIVGTFFDPILRSRGMKESLSLLTHLSPGERAGKILTYVHKAQESSKFKRIKQQQRKAEPKASVTDQ